MTHDYSDSEEIKKAMYEAEQEMDRISDDVGIAYAVERLSSGRRENILAKYVAQTHALDSRGRPRSVSERQSEARVMDGFHAEFEEHAGQLKEAFKLIRRWEVLEKRWDGNRSRLSFSKRVKSGLEY
jgi:hypothetical protein